MAIKKSTFFRFMLAFIRNICVSSRVSLLSNLFTCPFKQASYHVMYSSP